MIYVSSDWHGCPPQKIKELLAKADFRDSDFLYVIGDVIDRGRHGVALLKMLMRAPNMELILGNHEAMLLANEWMFEEVDEQSVASLNAVKLHAMQNWQLNGGTVTMEQLHTEHHSSCRHIIDYLWECPIYREITVGERDFLLVHGGLGNYHPKKPIDLYTDNELIWERPAFDTVYSTDFTTVIGHTPVAYYGKEFAGRILNRGTWIDIDVGVAQGNPPALLRLDDMREFYLDSEC